MTKNLISLSVLDNKGFSFHGEGGVLKVYKGSNVILKGVKCDTLYCFQGSTLKGNHRVYERLDKALGSKEWFTLFPETGIKHHPIQISDHAPIELDLHLTKPTGKNPYKLDAWVLNYLECIQVIMTVWIVPDTGSPDFRVARKLARVRQHVKKWALDKRNDWSGKWDDFDKRLEHGIELSTSGGGEEVYELVNSEATGATPPSFTQVLKNLQKRVTNDDADSLSKPFTAKEVHQAVFQMGPMKSPGPDGIPAIFYQRCWHLVKKDCTKAILSILNSGVVLKEMNRTFIVLVPKCDNPEEVKDYRPISLCNVFMRIVTKCITNRMQKVMGYLVGDYQNTFLAGRSISDNILLAHEAIHKVNTHKHGKFGNVTFKADMSKAFDRVRWDFLQAVLLTFGFPTRLVNLIMSCVSLVSYEILLNGAPLHPFKPQCGLRQGDPLSPYLFILCMEVLSCNMECAQREGKLQGIRVCHGVSPLTHLFFADDSIFFFQNKGMAVRCLKRLLASYCEASGQVINEDKSGIIFSPNTTLRQDICLNNGGWNEGLIKLLFAEESVGQILAIPLHDSQTQDEIFWPFTSSGNYTVKSGYGIIFREYFNENGSRKDEERVQENWRLFCRRKLWMLPGLRHGKSFSGKLSLVLFR
ncbi:uncharacterized protein LOC141631324 [Silene latifolia]|uniref:uncharacterized protein LOC141631324 n=1 Tax=Silene latifolia TaxID=37657 RepID=UPI003D7788F8